MQEFSYTLRIFVKLKGIQTEFEKINFRNKFSDIESTLLSTFWKLGKFENKIDFFCVRPP